MRARQYFIAVIAICGLSTLIYIATLLRHCPCALQSAHVLRSPSAGQLEGEGLGDGDSTQMGMVSGVARHQAQDVTVTPRQTFHVKLPPDHTYMARSVGRDVKPSIEKKLIVMFNRPEWLFPSDPYYQKVYDTCPYSCAMTDDRSQLPRAHAVWVDTARLNDPAPPPHRPPHQMWVAYNIESPVHYLGFLQYPVWKSVFNWTFSYRIDSDFFRPYGDFEFRTEPPMKRYTEIMLNKTKPIAWFVSNCYSSSRREQYVQELKRYIDVDIYGHCGKFHCPGLAEERCFRLLNTTYFFYLAFENSYCQDYVTEKLFKTYRNMNIIPIVRGGVKYAQYLPPNTYLDTANFTSPLHLANYLKTLMKDVRAYTDMLQTKDHFYTSQISWVFPNLKPFCELCKALQQFPPPAKVYPNIVDWSKTDKCWQLPRDRWA